MDTFARAVVGDTAVGAGLTIAYATAVMIADHIEGPQGEGFLGGEVLLGGGFVWLSSWALLLRLRRAPAWWAAPFACCLPVVFIIGMLHTERSIATVMIAFAVLVTSAAAGWSWLSRSISAQ